MEGQFWRRVDRAEGWDAEVGEVGVGGLLIRKSRVGVSILVGWKVGTCDEYSGSLTNEDIGLV